MWRLYCCFVRAVTEGGDWAPEMPCAASVTGYGKGKGKEGKRERKGWKEVGGPGARQPLHRALRRRQRGGEANNGVHALCCRMLSKSMSFKQMSGDHATPRMRPNANKA